MKWECRLVLVDDEGNRVFGTGPLNLLKKVDEIGSLHGAAKDMNMAYSKACKIINRAEDCLGFPLIVRTTGGKSGGGSVLTAEAKQLIFQYELFEYRVRENIKKEFKLFFGSSQ